MGISDNSTNYQDLDIDIYKTELWKLIKDVLRLLDCDMQNLEEEIFRMATEDENTIDDATLYGIVYTSMANKRHDIKANNIQRNESLDKYRSIHQSLIVLARSW
ncbi:MAG: hypothetical protein WB975_08440 [Nitrososphaeraceae archaeon]